MKISLSFTICYLSLFVALTSCSDSPEAEAMHRELLRAREMNTNYIPFTVGADSVMKAVVAYYDRHGTPAERMEAQYLLGCVYRDMGEAPQALQCFQEAVGGTGAFGTEASETSGAAWAAVPDVSPSEPPGASGPSGTSRLLIKVYGQMAELFDAQNLPDDEISAMKEVQRYALLEHDSLMYIRALELMTKPYYKLGDTAKVIETVWEAHRLYTEMGDSQKAVNAFATLAHIMVKRGQTEEADRLLKDFETKSGLFDEDGNIQRGHEMYYYIKGNYYLQAGKTDSAETFFRKLLPVPGFLQSLDADAYRGLLAVYQKRVPRDLQSLDSIVKYARLFEAAVDSLNNRKRIETVHQMAALYDYHRFQQKADMEALAASEARNRANIATVLIALILIVGCTLFVRYRKSKQKELDEISKECIVIRGLLAEARMELDEERSSAEDSLEAEMQEKLEEKTAEVKELENRLQQLEEHYHSVTQLATIEDRKNSEAVKAIRKRAEWKHGSVLPSADEWIKLTNQFRLDFPNYYAALAQGRKLSTKELRTCMLLMLDFKEGEIAVLLDVKPQRVTNIKKRVNMKLFNDSSATTLTRNIQAAS